MQLNTNSAGQTPSERYSPSENEVISAPPAMVQTMIPIPPAVVQPLLPPPSIQITQSKELLGLLRKYPIMWNGSIALKNDTANVQVRLMLLMLLLFQGRSTTDSNAKKVISIFVVLKVSPYVHSQYTERTTLWTHQGC